MRIACTTTFFRRQWLGKTTLSESYFLLLRREPDWTSRTASYKVSLETLLLKNTKIWLIAWLQFTSECHEHIMYRWLCLMI